MNSLFQLCHCRTRQAMNNCILGVIRMISQTQNDKGGVLNFVYKVVCELIRLVETTSSLWALMVLYNYGFAGFWEAILLYVFLLLAVECCFLYESKTYDTKETYLWPLQLLQGNASGKAPQTLTNML